MKIAILAANTGNGHISVMKALEKEFNQYESLQVSCFPNFYEDMMISNKILSKFYNFLMVNSTELCEKYCEFTYINRGDLSKDFYLGVKEFVVKFLENNEFDVVISVSHTINYCIIRILKELKLEKKINFVIVITDPYNPIAVGYAVPGANKYYCANERVQKILLRSKIPEEKIVISGYPVDSKFEESKANKEKIIRQFKFIPEKKIVLINAGANGINVYYEILKRLDKNKIQIIFLCGNNSILQGRCERYVRKNNLEDAIRIIPFTNEMDKYLFVSDIVITKAGANSIYESLMMEKPILIEAVNGFLFQEKGIINTLEKYHFGEILSNIDEVNHILDDMLKDENMKLYKKNIKKMEIKNGCSKIVNDIIREEKRTDYED